MGITVENSIAERDRELHVLLNKLETLAEEHRVDWTTTLDDLDARLREQFAHAGGCFEELLSVAPHWDRQVRQLLAGQQLLLAKLTELREAISDPQRDGELAALFSRWVSHVRAHEHHENRLIQRSYTIDIGGESG